MTFRTLLVLALVALLSILGSTALADGPDSDPGDGGAGTGGGEAGKKSEGDGGEGKGDKGKETSPLECGGGGMMMPMLLIGALLMMIMMSGRGRKKQQAKQNTMLANLKKGDKVRTIGGILASVVEVRDDEVVLRIDDNANTRMRVVRRAIAGKVEDGKKDDEDAR